MVDLILLNLFFSGPSCNVISAPNYSELSCRTAQDALLNVSDLNPKIRGVVHVLFKIEGDEFAMTSLRLICNDQDKCDLYQDGKRIHEKSGLNHKVMLPVVVK